jgi:hypothetical protein
MGTSCDKPFKASEMPPASAYLDQAAKPTYDAVGSRTEQTGGALNDVLSAMRGPLSMVARAGELLSR